MESLCNVLFLGFSNPYNLIDINKYNLLNIKWYPILRIFYNKKLSIKLIEISEDYDSIVFTSPRGVKALYWSSIINKNNREVTDIIRNKIVGVIGPSTASAFKRLFSARKLIMPKAYTSANLAYLLVKEGSSGVIGCRANIVSKDLGIILKYNHIKYKHIDAYRLELNNENLNQALNSLREGLNHFVILSSQFMAKCFLDKCRDRELCGRIKVIPIGDTTADYLARNGWEPLCVPSDFTLRGVLDCLLERCKV